MLEPRKEEESAATEETPEVTEDSEVVEQESAPEDDADSEQPQTVTIEVDGQMVEVTLDELKKGYQRQADYTRKTMAVAEQRKVAEAEATKLREERQAYGQKLQEQSILLQAALGEQQTIDWQQLLESDPVEYLKQQHLYQQRQAAYQRNMQEQQALYQQQQAEQAENVKQLLASQHELLMEKLPEWKDGEKAKAEKSALKTYMNENGFTADEINNLTDHRSVLVLRKAYLYDQMMGKAKAAAKKVENLPKKVERPGSGQSPSLDKRSTAYQRLSKSGKVEDAAAVFASLL
jgi:hypothetical protein